MKLFALTNRLMKNPKHVDMTPAQAEELIVRIQNNSLSETDRELCAESLQLIFWLQNNLREAKLSIKRLKSIFGIKTEKKLIGM